MKTTSFTFLILCLFSFCIFYSCADTPSGIPAVVEATSTPPSVTDTIHEDRYNLWASNWVNHGAGFTDTVLIKSFTIPQVDLKEVFGNGPKAPVQVRVVHGLDMSKKPYEAHLMVVGVNSSGASMIDYSNGQYVYDMLCPCPDQCHVPCSSN